jgi:DNA-binding transcriptional regulator YiaG
MPQSNQSDKQTQRDGHVAGNRSVDSTPAESAKDYLAGEEALSEAAWKDKQSRRIYHLRAQTGLTQGEFAALLGWSTSKQSQIEQNTDAVRVRPMDVMAARFVTMHPLEALKLSRGLSSEAKAKVLSYAERLEDFDVP